MSEVKIQVKDNGPFLVQEDVSILDAEGREFNADGKAVALCRCGEAVRSWGFPSMSNC